MPQSRVCFIGRGREIENAIEDNAFVRVGRACAGVYVGYLDSAFGRAVGAPKLVALRSGGGREVDEAVVGGDGDRRTRLWAEVNVLEQLRALGRAVAPPQLNAVLFVVFREEVEGGVLHQPRRRLLQIVAQDCRPAYGAVTAPQGVGIATATVVGKKVEGVVDGGQP